MDWGVEMQFDVRQRTILFVRHGSHAYGLNIETSDEDFKGVCIEPKVYHFGFLSTFEQLEHMGSKSDGVDSVIYSLRKFARLATDCNPNIIEILHVADKDVLECDEFGEALRGARNLFLSKRAKHTFSGYAHAQLKRIKTHRSWLLDPPSAPPTRKEFGLSETSKVSASELGAYQSLIDQTTIHGDVAVSSMQKAVALGIVSDGLVLDLPKDVMSLFAREKQYHAAKQVYDQYVTWQKTRNPARAELEARFGYDTKHGMHLLRLQRMALEIMQDHIVYVDRRGRGDRDELLDVRRGKRSFDSLIDEVESLEAQANEVYKTSTLRKEPDRPVLDALIVDLTERYLSKHG